jgi:hypothetical protein
MFEINSQRILWIFNEKGKNNCTLVHCTLVQYGHTILKREKEDNLFRFERRWEN